MVQMKVATMTLNGCTVGRFSDLVTLGSDATLQEALDYGYVTGKKTSLAAVAEGVCKAMIDGIKKDGNGRKIDDFVSINAFARGSLKDICEELGEKEFDSEGEGIGITDFEHPIAEGDTVKVVLEIDPSKTDYDQTPVEVVKTV